MEDESENTIEEKVEDNLWKGFKFPMGFFLVWKDEKLVAGKCDPLTKEVLHWYEVE